MVRFEQRSREGDILYRPAVDIEMKLTPVRAGYAGRADKAIDRQSILTQGDFQELLGDLHSI